MEHKLEIESVFLYYLLSFFIPSIEFLFISRCIKFKLIYLEKASICIYIFQVLKSSIEILYYTKIRINEKDTSFGIEYVREDKDSILKLGLINLNHLKTFVQHKQRLNLCGWFYFLANNLVIRERWLSDRNTPMLH